MDSFTLRKHQQKTANMLKKNKICDENLFSDNVE